jgi:hypothetical protein
MKYQTKTIANAADPASNITSEVLDLRFNYGVFIQAIYTGAPTGDIVLQGSNDQTTWNEISKVTISGSSQIINQDAIYAPYIRVFKAAGGTGTVTITATIKGA